MFGVNRAAEARLNLTSVCAKQKLNPIKIKNDGLGYRRISKELNRLGYKSSMGKEFYPSLISVIWKKIEKKQRILNQPEVKEYSDFDIVLVQLKI